LRDQYVVPVASAALDGSKAAWHVDAVEGGLVEFAAFVVVVAGQTHIDPVSFAVGAMVRLMT